MKLGSQLTALACAAVLAAVSEPTRVRGQDASVWLDAYRGPAERIIAEATGSRFAWQRLAELTDTAGHRLSGSAQLDRAIEWAMTEMRRDGLENVRREAVMVPRWVRGRERADIVAPVPHRIAMLGLGNSVGTGEKGIRAEVAVVRHFNELEARGAELRGKIVLFDVPYTRYEETVAYRADGPSRAARWGAVAALVRSVGPPGLRTPHTGAVNYAPTAPRIPSAAISTEDADRIQRMTSRGLRVVVHLWMAAHTEPDVESANVVGEITGRERPEEIVVVGAHLDSWDVGAGASDDGGGCVVTWEALRIMKKLGLRPRRTVRVVLFTNEENGARGGLAYRDQHRDELANHVMMLESDNGVARPLGFGFTGSEAARLTLRNIATLLTPVGADSIWPGGGGADIGPSIRAARIPAVSLLVDDSRYFQVHHTDADTVDKIDPDEMAKTAAAVTVLSYVVADLPQRLQ